jgi:hypothetical protein
VLFSFLSSSFLLAFFFFFWLDKKYNGSIIPHRRYLVDILAPSAALLADCSVQRVAFSAGQNLPKKSLHARYFSDIASAARINERFQRREWMSVDRI